MKNEKYSYFTANEDTILIKDDMCKIFCLISNKFPLFVILVFLKFYSSFNFQQPCYYVFLILNNRFFI